MDDFLGVCALCCQSAKLRRSHVIPNAVFREIKKRNGAGQLIRFDGLWSTTVKRSQESWHERLLCSACEAKIGKYEDYGIGSLRKAYGCSTKNGDALLKDHDYGRMKIFLTSILWRAAVANGDVFKCVALPQNALEEARISIFNEVPLRAARLGCKLYRLRNYSQEGGFSDENLRMVVISPFVRLSGGKSTFVFVMEGFILEFFFPFVPHRELQKAGVHRDVSCLLIPGRSFYEDKEIMSLMVAGYAKKISGKISPGI